MLRWLRSLTARSLPAPTAAALPTRSDEIVERSDEILEAIQKQTRAAAKQSARFEAAFGALEERLATLASKLEQRSLVTAQVVAPELNLDPVFDALDGLDAARTLAHDPHLAEGLQRVADRLEQLCEQHGYRRLSGVGMAPDPRVMRVVGTDPRCDLPRGVVSRVVRAALLRGDRVVREGNVIVSFAGATAEESDGQRLGS